MLKPKRPTQQHIFPVHIPAMQPFSSVSQAIRIEKQPFLPAFADPEPIEDHQSRSEKDWGNFGARTVSRESLKCDSRRVSIVVHVSRGSSTPYIGETILSWVTAFKSNQLLAT